VISVCDPLKNLYFLSIAANVKWWIFFFYFLHYKRFYCSEFIVPLSEQECVPSAFQSHTASLEGTVANIILGNLGNHSLLQKSILHVQQQKHIHICQLTIYQWSLFSCRLHGLMRSEQCESIHGLTFIFKWSKQQAWSNLKPIKKAERLFSFHVERHEAPPPRLIKALHMILLDYFPFF